MIKITYCITVADEKTEFIKLIDLLEEHKREEDNILVLVDSPKCNYQLEDYILNKKNQLLPYFGNFNGNFSEWKNKFWEFNLFNKSLGDYLFFIDADELPNPKLIENLPTILELNPDVDIFGVPRINFVKGITPEYIQQMNWRIDNQNRINYGDYQYRICKNNDKIRWGGKIHETLINGDLKINLPMNETWDLLHIKTFEKQQKQNNFYNSL